MLQSVLNRVLYPLLCVLYQTLLRLCCSVSTARLSGAIFDTFQPHRFGLCYTLFVIVVEQLSHGNE